MKLLYEKYGITEEDFISAELEAVPAAKATDIGLDGSMIGAYGHDDRVCPMLRSEHCWTWRDAEQDRRVCSCG